MKKTHKRAFIMFMIHILDLNRDCLKEIVKKLDVASLVSVHLTCKDFKCEREKKDKKILEYNELALIPISALGFGVCTHSVRNNYKSLFDYWKDKIVITNDGIYESLELCGRFRTVELVTWWAGKIMTAYFLNPKRDASSVKLIHKNFDQGILKYGNVEIYEKLYAPKVNIARERDHVIRTAYKYHNFELIEHLMEPTDWDIFLRSSQSLKSIKWLLKHIPDDYDKKTLSFNIFKYTEDLEVLEYFLTKPDCTIEFTFESFTQDSGKLKLLAKYHPEIISKIDATNLYDTGEDIEDWVFDKIVKLPEKQIRDAICHKVPSLNSMIKIMKTCGVCCNYDIFLDIFGVFNYKEMAKLLFEVCEREKALYYMLKLECKYNYEDIINDGICTKDEIINGIFNYKQLQDKWE